MTPTTEQGSEREFSAPERGRIVLPLLLVAILQGDPLPQLVKPHPDFNQIATFRCDFQDGEGRDSFDKEFARIKDGRLGELIFDSVNYEKRSARLIGNIGTATVGVIDGDLATSFLEVTSVGGLNITTIFKGAIVGSPLAQTFRAVSSRHIARSIGGETATQHYGTCKGLLP